MGGGGWGTINGGLGTTLTSSLFTVHVRLAAGRECRDVQLPRNMSPTRYRGRMPVMNGALWGVSARTKKVNRDVENRQK